MAFRAGGRYVARVVRAADRGPDSPALAVPTFSADGAFLITGGLGGLGLLVARWLVERGVRHLALVSRHEPTDAARAALEECERAGAKALVCLADVTDGEALAVALAEVERSLPPVSGASSTRGDPRTTGCCAIKARIASHA